MARIKWTKEKIIKRILSLEKIGEDLTNSNVKKIDSALVGAATSYFGNWTAALEAAGLDGDDIKKISKRRRNEKIKKWTAEKVVEEIRQKAETEEDLSNAYMKEKYPALVAAAGKYVGSWKKAVEMCGLDYAEVQEKGRTLGQERKKEWRRALLLERLEHIGVPLDESAVKDKSAEFYDILMGHFPNWRAVTAALRKRQKERE